MRPLRRHARGSLAAPSLAEVKAHLSRSMPVMSRPQLQRLAAGKANVLPFTNLAVLRL